MNRIAQRPAALRLISRILKSFLVAGSTAFLLLCGASSAQTVKSIYDFPNYAPIVYPFGPAVQGRDGALYTFSYFNTPMIFREHTSGAPSLLYAFTPADGFVTPFSPQLLGTNGNWYGTTGASFSGGVLYQVTPSGDYTVLNTFGNAYGDSPVGSPIQVGAELYGATQGYSTTLGDGPTIYTYNTTSGEFNVLYYFDKSQITDLGGALVHAANSNLYGGGTGPDNCGAAFEITPTGSLLNVYNFDCTLNIGPVNSPLLQSNDGNFYGTALGTYTTGENGTVFRMTPSGVVTVLHAFGGLNDGIDPRGGLVLGTDGNLYGTTALGGPQDQGTIYQISSTGIYSQLYSFGPFAWDPSGLMQHTDGKFYGYTQFTKNSSGIFYSLDMGLGPFVTFVQPTAKTGQTAQILGQGLTGTTRVTFNGVPSTSFKVVTGTYLTAIVPTGATTGPVVVTTPTGPLTSNKSFTVSH